MTAVRAGEHVKDSGEKKRGSEGEVYDAAAERDPGKRVVQLSRALRFISDKI